MPVKDTPVFTQTQRTATAVCTAAKTTYNDAANAVLLFTAGVDGAKIKRVWAMPRGSVTATQLQLYLERASAPGVLTLVDSALMAAYSLSGTTEVPATDLKRATASAPLGLAAGDKLHAAISISIAAGIVFVADPEDF